MKTTISAVLILALAVSCKKTKTNDFTQTDVTGTTVVKGNVSKNIVTPNGNGGWTNTTRIGAQGVAVSVKVNKSDLYPNSIAQGADVYSGTTDANGNYAITVRTNASGVPAQVTIDGFTGTMDTLVNGQVKTGFYASYAGTNLTRTLFMGQNYQLDYNFPGQIVSTNPNNNNKVGTATITGSVGINYIKEVTTGTVITLSTTNVAVPSHMVYLNFSNDPDLLTTKTYTAMTDANGYYSFTVKTVAGAAPGFPQNAVLWVADYATTRDTLKANNTMKTGRAGVYQMQTLNSNGIYNTYIRNANNFIYTGFTAN